MSKVLHVASDERAMTSPRRSAATPLELDAEPTMGPRWQL
jgi:hypothetical protein